MSSCVFPGSFDPVTAGHMDIIKRAAAVFDTVRVTVMINVNKQGTIPVEDRIRMLKKACRKIPNVQVDRWNGLLADYMREHGEKVLIRGVRGGAEFEHEYTSAVINRMLNDRFEKIDFEQAKQDVLPFIKNASALDLWGAEMFKDITRGIEGTEN